MRLETKFVRNFLSKPSYSKGVESVIIVLGMCLLASWYYWNPSLNISKYLAASYNSIFIDHEYWRLFTTSFVHADLKHLLANSLMLAFLTYFVSSFFGILISVFLSFSVAMLTNLFVISIYGGEITLVGASGVVYYLWGFWMVLYSLLQSHYTLIERFLRVGAVFLILLVPNEFHANTSYLAHYIGFGFGVITGGIYFAFERKKLKASEVWESRLVNDELTELDIIALNHPTEVDDNSEESTNS